MQADVRISRTIWIILLAGLVLRLVFALSQPTVSRFDLARGGDTGWYLANGYGFFSGEKHGWVENMPFYIEQIPTPPLYIMYAGFIQQFLGIHETIVVMRLLQCLASIATVYLACRLSLLITGDRRVAAVVAAMIAFHPSFVIEPANIATETLYIFFLTLGFWLFAEYLVFASLRHQKYRIRPMTAAILIGMALALATLTRAVSVLLPGVFVLQVLLLGRRKVVADWRSLSLVLLAVYAVILSTWSIYNFVLWDRVVVVSNQLLPALWRGAETADGAPTANDALLLQDIEVQTDEGCEPDCKYQHPPELYLDRIGAIVEADIAGFFVRRISELLYSLVQPHGTAKFGQVSIRDAASRLLEQSASPSNVLLLTQIEGFGFKLTVWALHIGGIALGLIGMWLSRAQSQLTFPLIGFVIYTVFAHLFLLALPRYMFPLDLIWLIFCGIAVVAMRDYRRRAHTDRSAALQASRARND